MLLCWLFCSLQIGKIDQFLFVKEQYKNQKYVNKNNIF